MMKMLYKLHPHFQYRLEERANAKMKRLVAKRLRQFQKNPHNTNLLDTHELEYAWAGFSSMDITPDWIVVYAEKPGKHYIFVTCGDKTRVLKPWNIPGYPTPDWITLKDKTFWK